MKAKKIKPLTPGNSMKRIIDTMSAADMKLSWARWGNPLDLWFDEMCKEMPGNRGSDIQYLEDLERGDYDCQQGNPAKDGESLGYEIGYGARYVLEQNQNHQTERGMK